MNLTFAHLTDTHLLARPHDLVYYYSPGDALIATLKHIATHHGQSVSFMVQTGDLPMNVDTPDGYDCAKNIYGLQGDAAAPGPLTVTAAGLNLPWYYVPGNTDDRHECLARLFGGRGDNPLFNFTWRQNDVRFLTLDWGAWKTDTYTLTSQTFDWFADQLRDPVPTVIFTHHPPVHVGNTFFDDMTPPDLDRLQKLIVGSSVRAIFHGHTHHAWEHRIGTIPVFGTGSTTFRHSLFRSDIREIAAPQYRLVTLKDDGSIDAALYHVDID
jgi:3',5'-cyclic AMP phosphodiesterase CpdA